MHWSLTTTAPFFKLSFKENSSISDGFGSFPHIQHGPLSAATPWEFRWLDAFVGTKYAPQTLVPQLISETVVQACLDCSPNLLEVIGWPTAQGWGAGNILGVAFRDDCRVMIEDEKSIAGIAWPKQSIGALIVTESLQGASFPHCADVTVASRCLFRFGDKPCAQKAMKSHLWNTLSAHRLKKPSSWPHKFGAFLRIFEQNGLSEATDSWSLSLPSWRLVVHGAQIFSFLFAQRAAMLSHNACKSARLQLSQLETKDRA